MKFASLCLLSLLAVVPAVARPLYRVSGPAPSPDGSRIAFSWQGDIWVASMDGGPASRLTVHPGLDQLPKWSPDGKRIVFCSDRAGSSDIWSMDPDGQNLRRHNFEGSNEALASISPDSKWAYGQTNQWGRANLFKLSLSGDQGNELVQLTSHPMEIQYSPCVSPDGSRLAFCTGASIGTWRKLEYSGANSGEIVLSSNAPLPTDIKKLTQNEVHDSFPTFMPNGQILFVSNRSGWPNIWRMKADGSGATQLTHHTRGAVRYPALSANGAVLAYEFDAQIWTLHLATGKTEKLDFTVPADSRTNEKIEEVVSSGGEIATSPDGKRSVVVVRGDIWLIPSKGGTTRKLTSSPALDQNVVWQDARNVLFISGRNGRRELWKVDIDGKESLVLSDPNSDYMGLALSPDKTTAALTRGTKEVVLLDLASGKVRSIIAGPLVEAYGETPLVDWSPDNKWLVTQVVTPRSSLITAIEVATNKRVVLGTTARGGSLPRWMPNGKAVYYTADGAETSDLYVVDLIAPETKFTEDDLDKIDEKAAKPDEKVEVKIDEHGLRERTRLIARDVSAPIAFGNTIYANVAGVFSTVSLTGAVTALPGLTGPAVLMPGEARPIMANAGKFFLLGGPAPQPIPFAAKVSVSSRDDERALFQDICWALTTQFYDPKMHNKDWEGIRAKFRAMLPDTVDRNDFYAMIGEMVEELNSSHQGATPPIQRGTGRTGESVGWLGVEWDPAQQLNGKFVVRHIVTGSPADASGGLAVGDEVVSINGNPASTTPPTKSLIGTIGTKVRFEIKRGGKEQQVLLKPTSNEGPLRRYEEWIQWNREQVVKLSSGKLTYHHIEGMDEESFQRFLWDIRTEMPSKAGLLLDVRFNGGGSTSHKVLGVLVKRPWLYRTLRGDESTMISENIFRGDALELPSALMTNQYSFSNAEILSEGFQRLKLGPVIGERTAGGVIGTGAYALWDGGMIRMPRIGCYTITGENLEGNGRKPTKNVLFDLNAWHQGRDVQLEAAVQELLRVLPRG